MKWPSTTTLNYELNSCFMSASLASGAHPFSLLCLSHEAPALSLSSIGSSGGHTVTLCLEIKDQKDRINNLIGVTWSLGILGTYYYCFLWITSYYCVLILGL